MRFEILFKQIVLFGIEDTGKQSPQLFSQRITYIGRFKIDVYRTGIGKTCRLAQKQAATTTFQFGFRITQRQCPGLGPTVVQLDVIFVRQTIASKCVNGVRDTISRRAACPPK